MHELAGNDKRVVIVGAGCAGLALAYWITELGGGWEVDIIDQGLRQPPRKLWSFWGEVPEPARDVVEQSWDHMTMRFADWTRTEALGAQRYHTVRSERYVSRLVERLSERRGVRFFEERVRAIGDLGAKRAAVVQTDVAEHHGRFVFQSVLPLTSASPARYPLRQHFGGWEVETARPQPNSHAITLMDFSQTSEAEMAFHYVLPLSPYRRLVEYTMFSELPVARQVYDLAVHAYLERHVDGPFRVVQREYGVIPMEERPLGQRYGHNVWNIGAMGGMTKGSTGYTFHRSQRQARHLAETLTRFGEPSPLPTPSFRFRFYDAVLLHLLARRPATGRRAFSQLFRGNSYADVLRFLDEQTRLGEEARIFKALPYAPFLRALARVAPALPALRTGHA